MANFRVNQFIIVPTGVYHAPANRHHSVNANNASNIKTLTENITEGGTRIAPSVMSELASKIIVPSASRGEVYIPGEGGFSNQRFRFMMELIHENGEIQYLAGYTDRLDHANGNLPDNLELYFNMTTSVRNHRITTENGQRNAPTVTRASEILSAPQMPTAAAYGGIGNPVTEDTAVTIRPSDLFSVSEALETAEALKSRARMQGDNDGGYSIGRVSSLEAEFRNGIRLSKSSNSSAGRYLGDVIGAYINSNDDAGDSDAFYSRYDEAISQLHEGSTSSDRFLNPIGHIGQRLQQGGSITWGMLRKADPNIVNMARDVISRSARLTTVNGRDAMNMTGNSPQHIAMVRILNGLAPLMTGNLVTSITFTARSGLAPGEAFSVESPSSAVLPNAFVDIANMQTFNRNMHPHLPKRMAGSILNEVISEVTSQFSRDMVVTVEHELLGDTTVNISLDGKPPIQFINPSWCSARSSLLIGHSQDVLYHMSNDLKAVFQGIDSNGHYQPLNPTPQAGSFQPQDPVQREVNAYQSAMHAQQQANHSPAYMGTHSQPSTYQNPNDIVNKRGY